MAKAKLAKEPKEKKKNYADLGELIKAYAKGELNPKKDKLVIDYASLSVALICDCKSGADHDDGPHYELYTADIGEALADALGLLKIPAREEG